MPTRKAYNEIHFFMDRVSRSLSMRSVYHVIYKVVCVFSNDVEGRNNNVDIYY
jgi:hypothetical protein